jgi:hypothetical protein
MDERVWRVIRPKKEIATHCHTSNAFTPCHQKLVSRRRPQVCPKIRAGMFLVVTNDQRSMFIIFCPVVHDFYATADVYPSTSTQALELFPTAPGRPTTPRPITQSIFPAPALAVSPRHRRGRGRGRGRGAWIVHRAPQTHMHVGLGEPRRKKVILHNGIGCQRFSSQSKDHGLHTHCIRQRRGR